MIVWVDIETSGLDPERDHILEVGLVVTDDSLVELSAHTVLVKPVGLSLDQLIEQMDPYVVALHTKSGLLADLRHSWDSDGSGDVPKAFRRYEAELDLIAFLLDVVGAHALIPDGQDYNGLLKATPLAGNTVSFDRAFLRAHMAWFESRFHYRSLDVTAFNEYAKRRFPVIHGLRPQAGQEAEHRALSDIRNSVAQLRHYEQHLMVKQDLPALASSVGKAVGTSSTSLKPQALR